MSAYGPALFVARKDNQPLAKREQDAVVALVRKHAKNLKLHDDDDRPVSPRFYDHDQYEKGSVAVLVFSSYLTSAMPDDIRADHEQSTCKDILKIGKAIDREVPGTYTYKAYYVED